MALPTHKQRARVAKRKHHSVAFSALAAAWAGLFWVGSLVSAAAQDTSLRGAVFQVIVHPSNSMTSLPREFLADAFFKRTTRWHDGQAIRPVDLAPGSSVRRVFSDSVLKRSVGAVRSYWQQRIFSGRDLPPPELDSDDAVLRYVAKSPGAIGYVSAAAKVANAKVVVLH
jgi:ABC-type phosphate transport system substrate-binding protein